MRKQLTLAIEAISVLSAVGVVVSAFVYSIHFTSLGLNYLAIASLADIVRDSLKLLILVVVGVLALIPTTLAWATNLELLPPIKRRILTFALAAAMIGMGFLSSYASVAIGGLAYSEVFKDYSWQLVAVMYSLALLSITFMRFDVKGVRQEKLAWRDLSDGDSPTSRRAIIVLVVVIWSALTIWSISSKMARQMDAGLPMTIELGDIETCPKKRDYRVAWIGDGKAVVKCLGSKKLIVKTLN